MNCDIRLCVKLVTQNKQMNWGGCQRGCSQLALQPGAGIELWEQRVEGARRISTVVRAALEHSDACGGSAE